MHSIHRRDALRLGAVGLASASTSSSSLATASEFRPDSFHYDHILGTSLDAWLVASTPAIFELAERTALAEFERLRMIFSLYDSQSELSKLNRSHGPTEVSTELAEVLREYQGAFTWTYGVCNAGVGALTQLWEQAAARGEWPDPRCLEHEVARIATPSWSIVGNVVQRSGAEIFNLNSIGKGYILQQVCNAVRAIPGVSAGLINLGGDLHAWGEREWHVDIQNPHAPGENEEPLTRLVIRNASVATSGSYARPYLLDGQRHSHILDPLTGRPADAIAGATVIAPNSTLANTLATALCVLDLEDGVRVASSFAGVEALLVPAKGQEVRTSNFVRFEVPRPRLDPPRDVAAATDWPADFELKVSLELPVIQGGKYRRPFVAVWIEDDAGKVVRTVQVWGSNRRWLATLSGWWKIGRDRDDLVKSVTRATRSPGKYDVVWDGKDDTGKLLPQGSYTVKVEVHREHGKDTMQTGKIACGSKEATIKLEKNAEAGPTTVAYAKKKKS